MENDTKKEQYLQARKEQPQRDNQLCKGAEQRKKNGSMKKIDQDEYKHNQHKHRLFADELQEVV